MKKNLFVVAAVALVAMVSCNKEEMNNGGNDVALEPTYYVEFTASIDSEDTQTKTSYDADNKKTLWTDGDLISVNGKKFKVAELYENGLSAKFKNDEELGGDFKEPYTAIYPYNEEGTVSVPATQTVSNGSFAEESVVTVAYSAEGNTLSFKHVSSVVKFQVATEGVNELTFSSSTDLAGTINVDANNATYSVLSGSKTITVKPANGTFSTTETYYVSVLPTLGEDKVDFAIQAEGVTVKSGDVNFKRNTVMDAKDIEVKYVEFAAGTWASTGSAAIGAYFFGDSGDKWVKMTSVADYKYKCVVPEGYTKVIFCRLDPKKDLSWDSKWNQTKDLTVPTDGKYRFVVDASGNWEGASGEWTNPANQIYFKPGAWTTDNAWFAAYFFGNSGTNWSKFTDKNSDGIFECGRLENYTSIIFCRMDPNQTALDWQSKWNQSADITLPTDGNNYFTVTTSGNWDGANGTWKKW